MKILKREANANKKTFSTRTTTRRIRKIKMAAAVAVSATPQCRKAERQSNYQFCTAFAVAASRFRSPGRVLLPNLRLPLHSSPYCHQTRKCAPRQRRPQRNIELLTSDGSLVHAGAPLHNLQTPAVANWLSSGNSIPPTMTRSFSKEIARWKK